MPSTKQKASCIEERIDLLLAPLLTQLLTHFLYFVEFHPHCIQMHFLHFHPRSHHRSSR